MGQSVRPEGITIAVLRRSVVQVFRYFSGDRCILELLGNKTLFSTGVRGFPISPLSLCCIQI